ncbi:MAG TPA: hypothetical protein DDW49_11415 [Deltaproteobacteria bacterium]|nr:MAG: hypothetical protein A2048_05625 [Deltaproteobacteria bacterium GWA2_45_12]HBF13975.1 hypothetical protein [Deltaproteobacteria bacterium]
MEGKGWAILALLVGVVIGANRKKLAKFLGPYVKNLGSTFENMSSSMGQAMGTVGSAATQGVGSTGHFLKGAWNQALHLVPGGQETHNQSPRSVHHRKVRRSVRATA